MEFRVKKKLDDKTETIIQNIIGAAIDVHRELGAGYLEKERLVKSGIRRFIWTNNY